MIWLKVKYKVNMILHATADEENNELICAWIDFYQPLDQQIRYTLCSE